MGPVEWNTPVKRILIEIGAIGKLPDILGETGAGILLVADENTYRAAGETTLGILASAGFRVRKCILRRKGKLAADEQALAQTLVHLEPDDGLLLAVGSGTVNDITRYVSYKTGKPYAVVVSAPSMDGYASSVAALTLGGCKKTFAAAPPVAIIADAGILAGAPEEMIRAGLGDMLGKFTSLADWWLGHTVCGEKYSSEVEMTVRHAVDGCLAVSDRLTGPGAVKVLLKALVSSGLAMLRWGDSRPASGSEHHVSHFMEMHEGQCGSRGHLHGTKVGIAEILTAELYHRVFSLELSEVKEKISLRQGEKTGDYIIRVEKAFGPLAGEILDGLGEYYFDEQKRRVRQENILKNWNTLQAWVRQNVPPAGHIKELLRKTGAPVSFEELGIPRALVGCALGNAKEVRSRYTIFRLAEDLGLQPESMVDY